MEQIIAQLINNFDFALMLILNVITYIAIKILDEINKEKNVTTWQKRLIFVVSAVIVGTIYYFASDVKFIKIIDSIIIAPVAWSWLAKPIAHKMGIDYRKIYK
jgi:hypothetical protein